MPPEVSSTFELRFELKVNPKEFMFELAHSVNDALSRTPSNACWSTEILHALRTPTHLSSATGPYSTPTRSEISAVIP